jgi:hypothetical protein
MIESATYVSFVVRLWRELGQATPEPLTDWYSEVECLQTGQRWTYHTLEALLDFLRQQLQSLTAPRDPGERQ